MCPKRYIFISGVQSIESLCSLNAPMNVSNFFFITRALAKSVTIIVIYIVYQPQGRPKVGVFCPRFHCNSVLCNETDYVVSVHSSIVTSWVCESGLQPHCQYDVNYNSLIESLSPSSKLIKLWTKFHFLQGIYSVHLSRLLMNSLVVYLLTREVSVCGPSSITVSTERKFISNFYSAWYVVIIIIVTK